MGGVSREESDGGLSIAMSRVSHGSKKCLETFLREVVVVCKDLGDPVTSHGRHRYAIDKAVTLVQALFVKRRPVRNDVRDCG